jgi:hypothetical protein
MCEKHVRRIPRCRCARLFVWFHFGDGGSKAWSPSLIWRDEWLWSWWSSRWVIPTIHGHPWTTQFHSHNGWVLSICWWTRMFYHTQLHIFWAKTPWLPFIFIIFSSFSRFSARYSKFFPQEFHFPRGFPSFFPEKRRRLQQLELGPLGVVAVSAEGPTWPRNQGLGRLNEAQCLGSLRATRPGKHTKNYGKSPFLMGT